MLPAVATETVAGIKTSLSTLLSNVTEPGVKGDPYVEEPGVIDPVRASLLTL